MQECWYLCPELRQVLILWKQKYRIYAPSLCDTFGWGGKKSKSTYLFSESYIFDFLFCYPKDPYVWPLVHWISFAWVESFSIFHGSTRPTNIDKTRRATLSNCSRSNSIRLLIISCICKFDKQMHKSVRWTTKKRKVWQRRENLSWQKLRKRVLILASVSHISPRPPCPKVWALFSRSRTKSIK